MGLRLGIDIACRAAHQASLADMRGEFLWSGHSFRTTARGPDALWSSLPPDTDPSTVTVVMEPTRNAWVALAVWFRRRGARASSSCHRNARPTCAPTTPSTPRATGSTPVSLPACLCSIPTASTRSAALDRVMRCAVRRSSTPRWSSAAASRSCGWMPSSRSSDRAGTRPWAATSPTRPRCASWRRAMPIRTRSGAWGGRGSPGSSPVTHEGRGARPRPTSSWQQPSRRTHSGPANWTTRTSPRTSPSRPVSRWP